MENATVIIRNKGIRTYSFPNGPGGAKRVLEPSKTLAVTETEAKQHLNYSDLEDAAQAVPQNAEMIAQLRAENAALRAEREKQIRPVLSNHVVTQVEKAIPPSEREGAYAMTVPATEVVDGDVSRPQPPPKPVPKPKSPLRKGR